MTVTLSPETERLIAEQMRRFGFDSPEAAICAGLALLDSRPIEFDADELDQLVQAGLESLQRGKGIPAEQVFADIRTEAHRRRQSGP